MNIDAFEGFGIFSTLVTMLLVILLHYPFDGYYNEYSYTIPSFTPCPRGDLITKMRGMETEKFNEALADCQDKYMTKERSFSDWRSHGAPNYWLSPPCHAIATILFLIAVGGVWLWTARAPRDA